MMAPDYSYCSICGRSCRCTVTRSYSGTSPVIIITTLNTATNGGTPGWAQPYEVYPARSYVRYVPTPLDPLDLKKIPWRWFDGFRTPPPVKKLNEDLVCYRWIRIRTAPSLVQRRSMKRKLWMRSIHG